MLKHIELLKKLSAKQKISLIADIHYLADDEYTALGIPRVKFATLEELFAKDGDGLTPYALARSWDLKFISTVTQDIIKRNCEDANVIIIPSPKINLGGEGDLALSEDPWLASEIALAFLDAVNKCEKVGVVPDFYLTKKDVANLDIQPDEKALHDFFYEPFSSVVKEGNAQAVIGTLSKTEGAYEDFNSKLIRHKNDYLPSSTEMLCLCKTYDDTLAALDENCLIFNGVELAIQNAYDQYVSIMSSVEKGRASMLSLEEALDHKTAISDQMLDAAVEKILDFAFRIQGLYKKAEIEETTVSTAEELPEGEETAEPANNADAENIPEMESFEEEPTVYCRTEEDEALLIRAIEKSAVLLKNNQLLPLDKKETFAIIGDAALLKTKDDEKSFAEYFSEYAAGNCVGIERGYDFLEDRSDSLIAPAVALAKKASTVFLFLKAHERKNLSYPCTALPANQTALLNALADCNCKIVAVLDCDLNVDVSFSGLVDGFVLSTIEGRLSARAIANVLFGRSSIGGKLTVSFHVSPNKFYKKQRFYKDHGRNKIGVFVGYRSYDTQGLSLHYPFGFGLKYSDVEITDATWSSGALSFTIANKGNYDIDETIEIFVGMQNSKLLRPKRELIDFHTVHLKAGSASNITVKNFNFKTYDGNSKTSLVESGNYTLFVGTSINKIQATVFANVNGKTVTASPPVLSDYLQSKTNILSNNYTLEAKHKRMANYKSLKNAGLLCLLLAILIALMSFTANAPLIPLAIASVFLLGAITLFVVSSNLKKRVKLEEAERIEKNRKLFQEAETTEVDQLEKLFLDEFKFDTTDSVSMSEDGDEDYVDSSAAMFNESMSFATAAADFKKSAGEFGVIIDNQCVENVIASFVASRLIIAKTVDTGTFDKFVDAVVNYFDACLFTETITEAHNPNDRLLHATLDDGSVVSTAVLNALLSAEEKPQVMHLIHLKNLQASKIAEYLIPYIKYFSNPDSTAEVSPKGSDKVYTIPNNVWFITELEKGTLVENVPSYILEHAALLPVKYAECEASETKSEFVPITPTDFEFLSERCKAKFKLNEDVWKKIDAIEAFVFKHASYKMGNKLWLKIETYLSTLMSIENDLPIAIDCTLAAVVLPTLAAALVGRLENSDKTLIDELERVFGEENVQTSHEMLVSKA